MRDFLRVLKKLEGKEFSREIQIEYQILLIKEKLYKPSSLPDNYKEYYYDLTQPMPYNIIMPPEKWTRV
ncbi:MAG: hypothetical protein Kow0090_10710 [Myxococcota bacterium]